MANEVVGTNYLGDTDVADNPKGIKDSLGKQNQYYKADKFTWDEFVKQIPKELYPSKIMGYLIGMIFILMVIIGAFNFPVSALLSGKLDIKLEIGLPMVFFVLNLENAEEIPIKIGGLLVDSLIYVFVAYCLNVVLNLFILKNPFANIGKTPNVVVFSKQVRK